LWPGIAGATTLIATYKDYFSAAYNKLRTDISDTRQQIETNLSDRVIAAFERATDQNATSVEFWSRFCDIAAPTLPAGTGETFRTLRDATAALVDIKAAGPLERIAPDETFTTASDAFAALATAVTTYNEAVRAANATIAAKKAAIGAANTATVETQLARLRATKKRHEPTANQACIDYVVAVTMKEAIERNKETVREHLDEYTRTVIGPYQNSINDLLEDFTAGFRITNTAHGYAGGVASSTYQISINDTTVDLGDGDTPLDRPSFRNTLSSGDRSTLALAFFLAQLMHDPNKVGKIVVFDDPFNSQDSFRREGTVTRIKRCGEVTAQVLVLSHDRPFLKRVWDRIEAADRNALSIARIDQTNSTILPWDIESEMLAPYQAQRLVLTNFHSRNEGNPLDVVQKIRLVLETHYRRLGSGLLEDTDNLGAIVTKIRGAGAAHQLFPVCDKLDDLNLYTCRYHHGENPNYAPEPIDTAELQGFVKKTLNLIDG
jgi:wobble nucleotide-excising tRNase